MLTDIGRSRQHAATPCIDRVGVGEGEIEGQATSVVAVR